MPNQRRSRVRVVLGLLILGVVLALVGGLSIWLLRPTRVVATALFRVHRESQSLLMDESSRSREERNFENVKKTQLALLHADFVMTGALRDPGISSLSIFASVEDPEQWLEEHLEVEFPEDGEILQINLAGPEDRADDLVHVVDAVAQAYEDEVIYRDRERQLSQRDLLARHLKELSSEITRKKEEYLDLARENEAVVNPAEPQDERPDIKWLDQIDTERLRSENHQRNLGAANSFHSAIVEDPQIAKFGEGLAAFEIRVLLRTQESAEMASLRRQSELLQRVADDMFIAIKRMDINATAPKRIEQIQSAIIETE